MTASTDRPWRTVVEVLLGVALAVVAVELWRRDSASGRGLPRIDGRWWAGAVGVATLAGILFLNAARRSVIALCISPTRGLRPTPGLGPTPEDRKVVLREGELVAPQCQDHQ